MISSILSTISQVSSDQELVKSGEVVEMEIGVKLLCSRILDKRVKGVNALGEVVQRVEGSGEPYRYLDREKVRSWMEKEGVKDILVRDRPHVEVLRRAQPVLCLLAQGGGVGERDVEEMWLGIGDKHESWVRMVYELMEALASVLAKDVLDVIYNQFRSLDLHTCPDFALHSMTSFTRNAARSLTQSQLPIEPYFLLDFNFFLSDPAASPQRIHLISSAIIDLLTIDEFQSFRKPLVLSLINGCGANRVAGILLKLMGSMEEETIKETLTDVSEDILPQLLTYISDIGSAHGPDDILRIYLDLLDKIVSKSHKFSLSDLHFHSLWTQFTAENSHLPHNLVFFNWLRLCLDSNSPFLQENELNSRIFSDFWCKIDVKIINRIGVEGFLCFQQYFLMVNSLSGAISKENNCVISRIHDQLQGLDALILFVLHTNSEEIVSKSLRLVSQLHTRVLKTSETGIAEKFVSNRLVEISKEENSGEIERNMRIVTSVMESVDYIVTAKAAPLVFSDWQVAYYRVSEETAWKLLHISKRETIGTLRRAISRAQHFQADCVKLEYGSNLYSFVDDEKPLITLDHPLHFTIRYELHDYLFPSVIDIITSNDEFLELLFTLISRQTSYRMLVWKVLARVTVNPGVQVKVREMGITYVSLVDANAFYKELFCLMTLRELKKQDKFVRDVKKVRPGEMLKWMKRLETAGQGEISRYFEGYSEEHVAIYAQIMLELVYVFKDPEPCTDRPQTVLHILELLYLYARSVTENTDLPRPSVPFCALQSIIEYVGSTDMDRVNNSIAGFAHLKELLISSLRRPKNVFFSNQMKDFFQHLTSAPLCLFPQLLPMLVDALPEAIGSTTTSREYFSLLSRLIKQLDNAKLTPEFELLWRFLREREGETHPKTEDKGLVGSLKVLKAILMRQPELRSREMGEYVLVKCLIDPQESVQPKCKSTSARLAGFKLLASLCLETSICDSVLAVLSHYHQDLSWRKSSALHWAVSYITNEKSTTGFVGLKNLGCTCYMNSMLQQLYMLPSFRQGLLSCEAFDPESVLYQLQKVMVGLRDSEKMFVQAKGLCEAYKNWEGEPVNVNEQMDVDEFFNGLMDKTEECLRGTSSPHLIESHFRGIMTTQCIGRGSCTHRSERDEPFLTIPLEIKNKLSILHSLEALVTGEVLEGDNAYECDYCSAKVTAKRRICLRSLPNVMLLALRRFDFDMDTMSRVKLNSYCEFPMTLDMEPYTLEYLTAQETPPSDQPRPPADYYLYTLRGIIIHVGYAEAGHYYSLILDPVSQKWMEFNDTFVESYNQENIPGDAFGVMEKLEGGISQEEIGKLKNAYVLIYERKQQFQVKRKDDPVPLPLQPVTDLPESSSVSSFHHHVLSSNLKYHRRKRLFSPEYTHFILSLTLNPDPPIFPFILADYLTIHFRYKDTSRKLVKYLYEGLGSDVRTAEWYLKTLSFEPMTRELLFDSGAGEGKKLLIALAEVSLKAVSSDIQRDFMVKLVGMIPKIQGKITTQHAGFFELIYRVTLINPVVGQELGLQTYLLAVMLKRPFPSILSPVDPPSPSLGRENDPILSHFPASPASLSPNFSFPLACLSLLPSFHPDDLSVFSSPDSISPLIKSVFNRFGANSLSSLYLSLPTPNFLDIYLETLLKLLNETDFDQHKLLFVQLKRLILGKGSEEEVGKVMAGVVEVMLGNLTYIRATESVVGFIYRLVCRNAEVRRWVYAHITSFQPLLVWKQQYQSWTSQSSSGLYLTKVYHSTFTEYKTNTVLPMKINLLISQKVPEVARNEDSDDDLYRNKVEKGGKMEFCPKDESYFRLDVVESYPGWYYYKYEGSDTGGIYYIPAEDDRLQRNGIKFTQE